MSWAGNALGTRASSRIPERAGRPRSQGRSIDVKAFLLESFGLDGLAVRDVPTPEPGPGQVLVAVKAASLNYRDLLMVKGQYDSRMPLPLIPLSDGAGQVVGVGPGVETPKLGDRVAGAFFQSWLDGEYSRDKTQIALGGPRPGALASHILLEAMAAIPFPASLSYEEAATLPCAGVTAWNALFGERVLRPGETVLVLGTGGVSMFALQFAKAAGARVIVTSGSDEKLKRALLLGADATVNYKSEPDWGAVVRKLTGGGVDCIVEVGGARTLKQALDAIRCSGRIEVIGVLSGVSAEIAVTSILHKGAHLRGIYVGSAAMFRQMNRAIEVNGIHPVIDDTFEFDRAPEALRLLESAGHFGKIVIRV